MFRRYKNRSTTIFILLLLILHVPSKGQYCTPVYTSGCTFFGTPYTIEDFILTGFGGTQISDIATSCTTGGYTDRTSVVPAPNLVAGQIYYGSIKAGHGSVWVQIWIDLNNDQTFQTTEVVTPAVITFPLSSLVQNYQISIPASASAGVRRMRVRMMNANTNPMLPCQSTIMGEAHDYLVNVIPAIPDDLSITAITRPALNDIFCSGDTITVKAVVNNAGTVPRSGFTINATYAGPTTGSMQLVYGGTLLPQAYDTVVVGQMVPALGGNYELKSYCSFIDQRPENDTAYTEILVDTSPEAVLNDTTICPGDYPFALNAGNTGCTYLWNNLSGAQSIDALGPGTYWVNVTSFHGCFVRDSVSIGSLDLPSVVGIDVDGAGATFDFTAGGPQHATSYYWDLGDGHTDTGFAVTHTYSGTGTYHVVLVVSNECGTDTAVFDLIVFFTSITEPGQSGGSISLYPNPTSESLNVDLPAGTHASQLLVADSRGSIVSSHAVLQQGKMNRVDVRGLAPGSYVLIIRSNKGNSYRMFQVVR